MTTQDSRFTLHQDYDYEAYPKILREHDDFIPYNKIRYSVYDHKQRKTISLNELEKSDINHHPEIKRFNAFRKLDFINDHLDKKPIIMGVTLDGKYLYGDMLKGITDPRYSYQRIAYVYNTENSELNRIPLRKRSTDRGESKINAVSNNNIFVGWYELFDNDENESLEDIDYSNPSKNKNRILIRQAFFYDPSKESSIVGLPAIRKKSDRFLFRTNSEATDISDDGRYIVGWSENISSKPNARLRNAFIYDSRSKAEHFDFLINLKNSNQSEAISISGDGSVVYGVAMDTNDNWKLVSWRIKSTNKKDLPDKAYLTDEEKQRIADAKRLEEEEKQRAADAKRLEEEEKQRAADAKRLEEEEKQRAADAKRLEEEEKQRVADAKRLEDEAKQRQEEAETKRIADEAKQRQEEAEAKRIADEAKQRQEEAEAKRIADEAKQRQEETETKRIADEKATLDANTKVKEESAPISSIIVSKPIDIENTYKSMQLMAENGYKIMDMQQGQLRYLASATCSVGTEKACISGFTHYQQQHKANATQSGLSGAYRIDINKIPLVVGLAIDTDIYSSLPKGYKYQGYALPLLGFSLDLIPSLNTELTNNALHLSLKWAYLNRKVSIERPQLEDTEAGKGNARLSGYHIELQGYYPYLATPQLTLTPFIGLTFKEISRSAYSETKDVDFIAHYEKLNEHAFLAKLGLGLDYLLTQSITLNTKAGMYWQLAQHQRDFRSHIDYLGQQNLDYADKKKHVKQRPFANVGMTYQFDKHSSIKTSANWEMTTYRNHDMQFGVDYTYRF